MLLVETDFLFAEGRACVEFSDRRSVPILKGAALPRLTGEQFACPLEK